ncbi:MAG TPA: TA system VapC family ribonuclease toxin [Bryobacteraceae bacterium]|nr:TA system VapC family ribonuclease toxin [Bryobacteraceae bacterium]
MSAYLLDVNVLVALSWPKQPSHASAQSWFTGTGHKAWATNAITQVGLLRLLTNPAVTEGQVNSEAALEALRDMLALPGHQFWPLDHDIHADLLPLAPQLRGHRLWTDALLLAQAARRGGVLVTFDAGVQALATGKLADHLLVLKSRAR